MNRTKFFKKLTVNNINEIDFLWNTLSSFQINHTVSYYRVKGDEVGQPDLISYRIYGTEGYWWVICIANQIENPLEVFEITFNQDTVPTSQSIGDIWRDIDNKLYEAKSVEANEVSSGNWEIILRKGLIEGSIIKIPDVRDIYDFYQTYAIR